MRGSLSFAVSLGMALSTVLAVNSAFGQQTYDLKYKLVPGAQTHFRVIATSQITTNYGEQSETVTNSSDTRKHFRVVRSDDSDTAWLEMIIDSVRMEAQFDENDPVVFDSTNPDQQPEKFSNIMDSVGKPLAQVKFANSGEMLDIHKIENGEVVPTSAVKDGEKPDPSMNFLVQLPEKPVKVGDEWDVDYQVNVTITRTVQQPIKLRRRYELIGVEKGIAYIRMRTFPIVPLNDPAIEAQIIQQTPDAEIKFSLEKGLPLERKIWVDNEVIGPFGDNTSMKAKVTRLERLVDVQSSAANSP